MSSVGKGVTSASIGAILQARGLRVTAVKADPYVNVDAGTMNPTEHGEVFVTNDGDETDQDMGNYERFLDVELSSKNYMTTGRVYKSVIEKERNLAYKGKCVEVVPHIPEEIISRIDQAAELNRADVTIVEIGGTVGEYQNILFLEAAREMKLKRGDDVQFVLVSYLPIPAMVGEMKTKPTQYASRSLNNAGIQADYVVCRSERELDKPRRQKIAQFCAVPEEAAISAPDARSIYDVPLMFEKAGLADQILKKFGMKRKSDVEDWKRFAKKIKQAKKPLKIAVVGKYFGTGDFTLADSYISVIESVRHACWYHNRRPELTWVDSERFEEDHEAIKQLGDYDGIIVPGGFGTRGIEGIISAIQYARENDIPYLGLCYGMQLACIEYARNVAGIKGAHTQEVDNDTKEPLIIINPFQQDNVKNQRYGGTMRLGAYDCILEEGSKAREAYGQRKISERHRHRYEFNNEYQEQLQHAGLLFSGVNPQQKLVEVIEIPKHKWFVGVQYHPEFKSRPQRPHPLFRDLVKAAL